MNENLYPELGESGKKEASSLLDKFKLEMIKCAEEALGDLYCDVVHTIESASWTNYRNTMVTGFCQYDSDGSYDYKKLRAKILEEHRDSIIKDLDQDNIEKIEELKKEIKWHQLILRETR